MKAAGVIQRIAFAVGSRIYAVNLVLLFQKRPDLVAAITPEPLRPANVLLVLALVAVGVGIWPVSGLLAKFVAGERIIR